MYGNEQAYSIWSGEEGYNFHIVLVYYKWFWLAGQLHDAQGKEHSANVAITLVCSFLGTGGQQPILMVCKAFSVPGMYEQKKKQWVK